MGGWRTNQIRLAIWLLAIATGVPSLAQNQATAGKPTAQQHQAQAQGHRQSNRHAGDWLKKYKDVPPDQQEKALENDAAFRRLPPDRQAKLRQQLQSFRSLPPQKQQKVLNRMQTWERLTPEQKMREIVSTITSKGQVTIPVQVRRLMGVGTNAKIAFVITDDGAVQLKAPRYSTVDSLRGAAGSLKRPLSKEEMLEVAHDEAAAAKSGRDR